MAGPSHRTPSVAITTHHTPHHSHGQGCYPHSRYEREHATPLFARCANHWGRGRQARRWRRRGATGRSEFELVEVILVALEAAAHAAQWAPRLNLYLESRHLSHSSLHSTDPSPFSSRHISLHRPLCSVLSILVRCARTLQDTRRSCLARASSCPLSTPCRR